jgi:hypothetical protein
MDSTGPKGGPNAVQQARQLEPVVGADCTGEYGCPGVYRMDQGGLAVQGRLLKPGELPSGAVIPAGEAFVEIPRELLIEAARRLTEGGQAS